MNLRGFQRDSNGTRDGVDRYDIIIARRDTVEVFINKYKPRPFQTDKWLAEWGMFAGDSPACRRPSGAGDVAGVGIGGGERGGL